MEPRNSVPNFGPEQLPTGYEQFSGHESSPTTPENGFERGQEQVEQRGEAAALAATTAAPILPMPVVPLPVALAPNDGAATASNDAPIAAGDDDLIEKEWVDQAKKIILQTKDDPYRREQEVSKLQADYLRKRYGRELGASQ